MGEDGHDIVHEPEGLASVSCAVFQHDLVQEGQQEVRQDLRGDIPDGRADVQGGEEQALLPGQHVEKVTSPQDAVVLGLMPEDSPGKPEQGVQIFLVVVLQDEGLQELPQDPAVDGHEEGAHVQLYDPGLPAVALGDLLYLQGEVLDSCEDSEVLPAVVGYISHGGEAFLDQRDEPDADPVLGDTVPEIGGEDLAETGSCYVETDGCGGVVDAQLYLGGQEHQVVPYGQPVVDALLRRKFMEAAILEGQDPGDADIFAKCCDGAHHVGVVLVVVVDVAGAEVDVPGVGRVVLQRGPEVRRRQCAI